MKTEATRSAREKFNHLRRIPAALRGRKKLKDTVSVEEYGKLYVQQS
jgi:hypothetical protein